MKVGDYVRIINTLESYVEIIKIKELNEYDGYLLDERNYRYSTDEIIKSSPNIIDLIEIGDYVNGFYVLGVYQEPKYLITDDCSVYEEEIKSIVTKEQFESMEYKVGE